MQIHTHTNRDRKRSKQVLPHRFHLYRASIIIIYHTFQMHLEMNYLKNKQTTTNQIDIFEREKLKIKQKFAFFFRVLNFERKKIQVHPTNYK